MNLQYVQFILVLMGMTIAVLDILESKYSIQDVIRYFVDNFTNIIVLVRVIIAPYYH